MGKLRDFSVLCHHRCNSSLPFRAKTLAAGKRRPYTKFLQTFSFTLPSVCVCKGYALRNYMCPYARAVLLLHTLKRNDVSSHPRIHTSSVSAINKMKLSVIFRSFLFFKIVNEVSFGLPNVFLIHFCTC